MLTVADIVVTVVIVEEVAKNSFPSLHIISYNEASQRDCRTNQDGLKLVRIDETFTFQSIACDYLV